MNSQAIPSDKELDFCPHCGSVARFHEVPSDSGTAAAGGHYIECSNSRCGATSSLMFYEDNPARARKALLARWNRRSGPRMQPETAREITPPEFPTDPGEQWTPATVQAWINTHWALP